MCVIVLCVFLCVSPPEQEEQPDSSEAMHLFSQRWKNRGKPMAVFGASLRAGLCVCVCVCGGQEL